MLNDPVSFDLHMRLGASLGSFALLAGACRYTRHVYGLLSLLYKGSGDQELALFSFWQMKDSIVLVNLAEQAGLYLEGWCGNY